MQHDYNLSYEKRAQLAGAWLQASGLVVRTGELKNKARQRDEVNEQDVRALLVTLTAENTRAAQHYLLHPAELEQDRALVAGVCPLFVLHALVTLLRRTDSGGKAAEDHCHECLLALHCLRAHAPLAGDARLPALLLRLFDLVYDARVWQALEPTRAHCHLIVIALCEGLTPLLAQVDGAPHQYATHSLSEERSLAVCVRSCLFRSGSEEARARSVFIADQVRADVLTQWALYQHQRYQSPQPQMRLTTASTTL